MSKCSVDFCSNGRKAKGLCHKHYAQMRRRGKITDVNRNSPNEICQHKSHAIIYLRDTWGEVVGECLIDLEDIDTIRKFKWHLTSSGYAMSNKKVFIHRVILNVPEGKVVDHINGDPLDNRRTNLRICTQTNNLQNSRIRSDNTSGFKGVYFKKDIEKYYAAIQVNKKKKHLGYYENIEDARKARVEAEKKYFGAYRKIN